MVIHEASIHAKCCSGSTLHGSQRSVELQALEKRNDEDPRDNENSTSESHDQEHHRHAHHQKSLRGVALTLFHGDDAEGQQDPTEMKDIIEQGGIESAEDLAMFGDKDIDTLFQQAPHLKGTPLLKKMKLKGLAEWLRDRSDEGNGFPIHEVTPADINEKLLGERARS
jgi:hypothetical protein